MKSLRKLLDNRSFSSTNCVGKTQRIQKEVQTGNLVIKATKLIGGFVFFCNSRNPVKILFGQSDFL
jgi:hypothetical protein